MPPQAGQVALNVEAGANRGYRAGELGKVPVPGLRENAPGLLFDPVPDHLPDPRQARERVGFRRAHLRRIAHDIARHEGRKSAFHAHSRTCSQVRVGT